MNYTLEIRRSFVLDASKFLIDTPDNAYTRRVNMDGLCLERVGDRTLLMATNGLSAVSIDLGNVQIPHPLMASVVRGKDLRKSLRGPKRTQAAVEFAPAEHSLGMGLVLAEARKNWCNVYVTPMAVEALKLLPPASVACFDVGQKCSFIKVRLPSDDTLTVETRCVTTQENPVVFYAQPRHILGLLETQLAEPAKVATLRFDSRERPQKAIYAKATLDGFVVESVTMPVMATSL